MLTAWDKALLLHIARGKRWHDLTPHAQAAATRLEEQGHITIDRSGVGRITIVKPETNGEQQAKGV